MQSPLAFVGLGIMGRSMAGHLLKADPCLAVNTRTKATAGVVLAAGASWHDSAGSAAAGAAVTFICVPDTPDVEAVLFGPGGVAESAMPGSIIVDHSTISPSATQAFARRLAEQQVTLLDAPVSGGDIGAKNATLSIMVGGDRAAFDKVEPLLRHMGKTITYCGLSGSGQMTKLVNQILVSLTNLAVCEAMTLAKAGGLDPVATLAAVGGGAAGSWQLNNLGPRMLAGDFAPGFMIDLQQKDLRLVQEAATLAGLSLAAVNRVAELFSVAQSEGMGKKGTQALFQVVANQSRLAK